MEYTFSICIPSIGRETLYSTIDSILGKSPHGFEVNLFLNGVDPRNIQQYIHSNYGNSKIQIHSSPTRLEMWESIQTAMSMGTADYIWLLGDDDVILSSDVSNFITRYPGSEKVDLIVWNGIEIDSNGTAFKLSTLKSELFELNQPSSVINLLCSDMSILNNGRFAVSRELRDLMLKNNSGFEGTFHDEYGSLFTSILELLREKETITILSPKQYVVGLGLVVKSWSTHHAKAILGQEVMLCRLPQSTEPERSHIVQHHLNRIRTFPNLIVLRLINQKAIEFPKDLEHDVTLRKRILLVNKLPILLGKYLGPLLCRFYNSSNRKNFSIRLKSLIRFGSSTNY